MGGVDKFDQMIKYYSLKRKTIRWPQRFTLYIIQILIHNSYVLYNRFFDGKRTGHYDYQCKFVDYLIRDSPPINKRKLTVNKNSEEFGHYPVRSGKRIQCAYCIIEENFRRQTNNKCEQCNVYLCIYNCFKGYHSSKQNLE
ncbi:PiggyBac transposable element-derived protein 4 [Cucumispora dikerogammari]|nr:PiggyBac transposable element-derived protein 4 [Cucumispora dikerogammari]